MLPRLGYKLHEGGEDIVGRWNVGEVAHHIHRVVPVGLHLNQFEVGWSVECPPDIVEILTLIPLQLWSNRSLSQLAYDTALTRATNAGKEEEGLGLNC